MSTTESLDELRNQILIEFKQVLKLAPADYTENCTNAIMSMLENYATKELLKEIDAAIGYIEMIGDETDQAIIKPYFLGRRTKLNTLLGGSDE